MYVFKGTCVSFAIVHFCTWVCKSTLGCICANLHSYIYFPFNAIQCGYVSIYVLAHMRMYVWMVWSFWLDHCMVGWHSRKKAFIYFALRDSFIPFSDLYLLIDKKEAQEKRNVIRKIPGFHEIILLLFWTLGFRLSGPKASQSGCIFNHPTNNTFLHNINFNETANVSL